MSILSIITLVVQSEEDLKKISKVGQNSGSESLLPYFIAIDRFFIAVSVIICILAGYKIYHNYNLGSGNALKSAVNYYYGIVFILLMRMVVFKLAGASL